jgi:tetratricopeptide (TPR) repeat protein
MLILLVFSGPVGSAQAGIYIRGEKLQPQAPLEKLEEFWKQLQFIRAYGPTDKALGGKPTTQRQDFLAKVEQLRRKGNSLSPDEQADLGGYLLYLKQTATQYAPYEEAVAVLEAGYRNNPRHFALASNLGTAYQLSGRLDAAERCLDNAVEMASAAQRPLEQLQLTLVRRRLHENLARGQYPDLDLIFGRPATPFHFVGKAGVWNYGELAPTEMAKLPGQSVQAAVPQVQQLLVWLPDDGRLIWQLGEWALVLGQKKTAVMLFNESVNSFRLSHPDLKKRRLLLQEAMHWFNLLEQVSSKGRGEVWIVQTLGESAGLGMPLASLGSSAEWLAGLVPTRTSAADLLASTFNEKETEPTTPVAQGVSFVLQPWHWVLIVIGVLLALAMIVWQVQQFFRPKSKPASLHRMD